MLVFLFNCLDKSIKMHVHSTIHRNYSFVLFCFVEICNNWLCFVVVILFLRHLITATKLWCCYWIFQSDQLNRTLNNTTVQSIMIWIENRHIAWKWIWIKHWLKWNIKLLCVFTYRADLSFIVIDKFIYLVKTIYTCGRKPNSIP